MDINILNTSLEPDGVLDVYESFIWTDRFDKCGDFEIFTTMNSSIINKVYEDYILEIADSDRSMIIEDIKINTDNEDGDKLSITGRSLESILERRVVWGQTTVDGTLQDGIKTLINENVISPTNASRQIPNFIFKDSTDPAITALTLKAQLNGENLYKYITEVCEANDIGFKVLLVDGNFEFELYSGIDRSYDQITNPQIVFSEELDNLISSEYFKSKKKLKTVSLVEGEGEGSNRLMVEAEKIADTGLARREIFVDGSSISQTVDGVVIPEVDYIDQLRQKGLTELSDKKAEEIFDAEVEHGGKYRYGEHYFMGDIVQIVNEYGIESKSRVTEYIVSEDLNGYKTYPTFTKID